MNKNLVIIILFSACIMFFLNSCKHDPIPPVIDENTVHPPPGDSGICFANEILPLIQSYCSYSGCHDGISEGMNLTTYNDIMEIVKAGNADESKLYQVIIGGGEENMPPYGKPQLTTEQVVLIHNWIEQGALNTTCSCDTSIFTFSGAVLPTIQAYCKSCHSAPPVNLSDYTSIVNAVNNQNLYGSITGTGTLMPPSGKMPECRITQIGKWIGSGKPNN